jgi:hypothetical protein
MIIPLIVPLAISGVVAGGGAVWLFLTNGDIDDVILAMRKKDSNGYRNGIKTGNSTDYEVLREIYMDNFPKHGEEEFIGFMQWFVAGVVLMRMRGDIGYDSYESDNQRIIDAAVYKVRKSYEDNNVDIEPTLVSYAFEFLIRSAWATSKGHTNLIEAEKQNALKTLKNAWDMKAYDKKSEAAEEWEEQNATVAAAIDKAGEGIGFAMGSFAKPLIYIVGAVIVLKLATGFGKAAGNRIARA